jgi:hypothetical protein
VVGLLLGTLLTRRHITRAPGVFKARMKLESGSLPGLNEKWGAAHAVWVHDILLAFKGVARARVLPLPVAEILQMPQAMPAGEVKRLGDRPQALRLRLDNGAVVSLAVDGTSGPPALPERLRAPLLDGDRVEVGS